MKIELRDEQGNVVTPRKGDYVMACDIDNEEMHNAIRDAFADAGCVVAEYGKYVNRFDWHWVAWLKSSYTYGVQGCLSWADPMEGYRRLYPHAIKQTLFEAAKDAKDGTRFKLGCGLECFISNGTVIVDGFECGKVDILSSTDFYVIQQPPRKRDVGKSTVCCREVPSDMFADCCDAFKLICRLAMWEGAQIGKPGYAMEMVMFNGQSSKFEPFMRKNPAPITVTFKTKEQCEAAWKAEFPEMFE